MIISKGRVDSSLRSVRTLYRSHANGQLSPSSFATKARAELNALYIQHTRELIETTAGRVMEELKSFQTQFGLDLDCDLNLTQVARGYRGIRASIYVSNKKYAYYSGFVEIFIGPFDEWDRIAVHTVEEREVGKRPSFYTKRRSNRWQELSSFNFPNLLQRIKKDVERRPEPDDDEDDIAF
jgi:hypothetical protein